MKNITKYSRVPIQTINVSAGQSGSVLFAVTFYQEDTFPHVAAQLKAMIVGNK